jgi:hypothetical protein
MNQKATTDLDKLSFIFLFSDRGLLPEFFLCGLCALCGEYILGVL